LAPSDPRKGPVMLRAPSYVISANRFTMPIIRTNPNAVFAMSPLFLLIVRQHFLSEPCVEGPCAGTDYQQEYGSEQHREVSACFVRHTPETVRRQFTKTKSPNAMAQKNRNFG